MSGVNHGTTYVETYGTTSPVTGSAPTAADDGQPLPGLSAITLVVSAPAGNTLGGAGNMVAYLYDPAVLSPNGIALANGGSLPAAAVALAFDGQSGNFTVGQVVTGATSGATGTLRAQADAGTTGTLYLTGVVGTFVDNEAITDPITGAALVNGAPASSGTAFLAYDAQSGNFTVGLVVTGGTSGATGRITADVDAGATGTLALVAVTGTFADNEALTDSSTGAATVNGVAYNTLAYDNTSVAFEVTQVVTGATSAAVGTISSLTSSVLTFPHSTFTPAFVDNEALLGVSQPRWLPLPSADFAMSATSRDQAFIPVTVETPRRQSRIKWVPSAVDFAGGGSGLAVHQLGFAPGSAFVTAPTGGR